MDLATWTNAPRHLEFHNGDSADVAALTLKEWGVLQQWLKEHVASPMVLAKRSIEGLGLAREDRQAVFFKASQIAWPPKPGTQAWFDAIDRADDQHGATVAFLTAVLRDADRAEALAGQLDDQDLARLNAAAFGVDDPKAPPA